MTLGSDSEEAGADLLQQVVSIVSAYVSHNAMRAVELPEFIGAVHASIRQLSHDKAAVEVKPPESPAVPVKRSVSKDFIVCLECGKKFKSLRRHLSSFHGLSPDEYRAKWSLQSDYPMVAPAYSATRSQLARDSGLGQVSRGSAAETPSEEVKDEETDFDGPSPVTAEAPTAPPKDAVAQENAAAPETPDEAAGAAAAEAPKKAKRGRPRKVAA